MKKLFILLFTLLAILLVQLVVSSHFHKNASGPQTSYSLSKPEA